MQMGSEKHEIRCTSPSNETIQINSRTNNHNNAGISFKVWFWKTLTAVEQVKRFRSQQY